MEKPLVTTMIAKMIQCKASIPHNIIRVEMNATPIVVEALTKQCLSSTTCGDSPNIDMQD